VVVLIIRSWHGKFVFLAFDFQENGELRRRAGI
jgi:hypothetical protein